MSCCCPKEDAVQKITVEEVIAMPVPKLKPSVAMMLREQQEERENNVRMRTVAAAHKTGITSDGALTTARLRNRVIA